MGKWKDDAVATTFLQMFLIIPKEHALSHCLVCASLRNSLCTGTARALPEPLSEKPGQCYFLLGFSNAKPWSQLERWCYLEVQHIKKLG